jgi:hypothetical protein
MRGPSLHPEIGIARRYPTPAWVASRLTALLGADLVLALDGRDITVDGSNNVTAWPARVGPNPAYGNARRFKATSTTNGMRALTGVGGGADAYFSATVSRVRCVWLVGESPAQPFPQWQSVIDIPDSGQWIAGQSGTTHWGGIPSGFGFEDGKTTFELSPDGTHVWRVGSTTSTLSIINIFGLNTVSWPWLGKAAYLALSASVPDANTAAAVDRLLLDLAAGR